MINVRVTATTTGPLFNGSTQRHLHLAVDEAEQEIATIGADHLRGDLGRPPFKNPTGWYKSHITPKKIGALWVVQDSGVVYGPWLAGTSSRNHRSRFKGYHHWRRLTAFLHRISKPTTDKVISRAVRRAG
jgi:hypothetical protein